MHGLAGDFTLRQCALCGLICLDPRPTAEAIARFYPEDYLAFQSAPGEEPSRLKQLDRRTGIEQLCRPIVQLAGPRGRILDVGCATGNFLDGMRTRGWETWGVEPSAYAARYAREHLRLDVREGTLEQAGFTGEFFDVITLWHVFEHVYDPQATLAEAARILKPGGWVSLTVPNLESWEARLMGRYWLGWDIPRHLFLYPRPVLRRYLAEAGFEQIRERCITGKRIGLTVSLKFWATDWRLSESVRRRILALADSLFLRALIWPYYQFAALVNQTSFITVFARRQKVSA
jgi:SAM-dependent methyltransferase